MYGAVYRGDLLGMHHHSALWLPWGVQRLFSYYFCLPLAPVLFLSVLNCANFVCRHFVAAAMVESCFSLSKFALPCYVAEVD